MPSLIVHCRTPLIALRWPAVCTVGAINLVLAFMVFWTTQKLPRAVSTDNGEFPVFTLLPFLIVAVFLQVSAETEKTLRFS